MHNQDPRGPANYRRKPWWAYWWVRGIIAIVACILFAGLVTGIMTSLRII